MASLNKMMLIGNLGANPEIRTLPSGDKVANFNMATTESYRNKSGEKVEDTDWHRIEIWGTLANIVEQYLKKGDSVFVEGRIKNEKYTDANGIDRFVTKVKVNNIQMLGKARNENAPNNGVATETAQPVPTTSDDNLPF